MIPFDMVLRFGHSVSKKTIYALWEPRTLRTVVETLIYEDVRKILLLCRLWKEAFHKTRDIRNGISLQRSEVLASLQNIPNSVAERSSSSVT